MGAADIPRIFCVPEGKPVLKSVSSCVRFRRLTRTKATTASIARIQAAIPSMIAIWLSSIEFSKLAPESLVAAFAELAVVVNVVWPEEGDGGESGELGFLGESGAGADWPRLTSVGREAKPGAGGGGRPPFCHLLG